MEPAFQRGDLLFLWNRNLVAETQVGEIVVYNVKDKDIPIVHRVIRKFGAGWVMSGWMSGWYCVWYGWCC
jgi:signal peptidase